MSATPFRRERYCKLCVGKDVEPHRHVSIYEHVPFRPTRVRFDPDGERSPDLRAYTDAEWQESGRRKR